MTDLNQDLAALGAALEDARLFKTTPPPVIGWPSLAALGARALWVAN